MTEIDYSDKYNDDLYEYRHVTLPERIKQRLPQPMRLFSESEWRGMFKLLEKLKGMHYSPLGIQQSRGWVHYAVYAPEPHVMLFRRPLGTDPQTGQPARQW